MGEVMDRRQLSSVADTREANAMSHPDAIGNLVDDAIAKLARTTYQRLSDGLSPDCFNSCVTKAVSAAMCDLDKAESWHFSMLR